MKAKEIYIYVFAALFVIGFFVLAVYPKTLDAGIIETIKNGVILIIGYFFGSSKGSSDKNELLKK
jgi:hypothetical protein